jgi:hypothetical protein
MDSQTLAETEHDSASSVSARRAKKLMQKQKRIAQTVQSIQAVDEALGAHQENVKQKSAYVDKLDPPRPLPHCSSNAGSPADAITSLGEESPNESVPFVPSQPETSVNRDEPADRLKHQQTATDTAGGTC